MEERHSNIAEPLRSIVNAVVPPPRNTRDERITKLQNDIAEITTMMRGPMLNVDRACAHLDRRDLREELARLQKEVEAEKGAA